MADKLEVIYQTIRESIAYRRSREGQIFAWSAAVLVAVTTALLCADIPSTALISTDFGKIMATLLVMFVALGSCAGQLKQRKLLCESQSRAAKVMDAMGLFETRTQDTKAPLLPSAWRTWGSRNAPFETLLFQPSKLSCTVILGTTAIIVIWNIHHSPA